MSQPRAVLCLHEISGNDQNSPYIVDGSNALHNLPQCNLCCTERGTSNVDINSPPNYSPLHRGQRAWRRSVPRRGIQFADTFPHQTTTPSDRIPDGKLVPQLQGKQRLRSSLRVHYDASGHHPHASLFVYPGQIHVEGESLEALTVRLRAPVEQSQNFAHVDTVPRAP